MTHIWLIRHAESESNAGHRTTDPANIPITSRGHEQARHVASAIPSQPNLLITSSYLRSKQTAEPLVHRYADIVQVEWPIQEFTYLTSERYQNFTTFDREPWKVDYWTRNDPSYVDGSGAESFTDLFGRIESCVASLSALDQNFVVMFGHGQFFRALLWYLLSGKRDISPTTMDQCRKFMYSFEMPNGAITKLQFEGKQTFWMSGLQTSHIPPQLLTR